MHKKLFTIQLKNVFLQFKYACGSEIFQEHSDLL